MLPEHCRHHVEAFSLLVALAVKYDGNATTGDNAPPGDGQRYNQRQSSALVTTTLRLDDDNATSSESSAIVTTNLRAAASLGAWGRRADRGSAPRWSR
jgi:hypothetical protein